MKSRAMCRPAGAGDRLLRTPPPQPDESLMGYILRLSESNYYESPKWILDLAGLKTDRLRDGWRKLCDDRVDFTLFRQITGLNEDEVNEMKHKIIRDSDDEECDAQWDIPINSLRFDRPKVCSGCLRENSYCRKFWDLPTITVCPRHQVLLLDICPGCREPISWNRKGISQCRCGCDWRETVSPELPASQLRAMDRLMRSLRSSEKENATMRASAMPLERLSFGDLSRVMLCLTRFVSVGEPGMEPTRMENWLWHQALEQIAAILDDWPDGFHRLCDRHTGRLGRNDLTLHIDRLADRPPLMFLRIAMEEHLVENARYSNPAYDHLILRRFIPMEEAGERMGLKREGLNVLVSGGSVRVAAGVSDPQTILIDARSIEKLLEERRRMITAKMAAVNLGITDKDLSDLIDYGHLKATGGPQIDGFPETVFEVESLLELYRRVEGRSVLAPESGLKVEPTGELMEFVAVRKQLQAGNICFSQWLQAVIDGEMIPFKMHSIWGYDFDNIRLTHFAFLRDQLQQYIARNCPESDLPIPIKESGGSVNQVRPKRKRRLLLSEMTVFLKRRWDSRQLQLKLDEIDSGYDATELKRTAERVFKRPDVRATVCSDGHRRSPV